ncbi:PAS domain-containing protein [Massilia sp. LXY-6]|uniref:PAS domain-containing protein n=1 Tax=Massilia sp. LXY-6 TaxID=3379823 RepID=UPI003EDEEEA8
MHHPIPSSEHTRIKALDSLDVLDTPAEQRFDRFTRLAAMTFGVPVALVSLVDEHRQWFKSRCGLAESEMPRSIAFCSHAVAQGDLLVVEDAARDPRFAANPLVAGAPHVRFYAGQPLFSDGQPVGTLCIVDYAPRSFGDAQQQALRDLADLVEVELNHVKLATARLMAEQALKALNTELEQRVAARTAELERKLAELSQEIAHRKEIEVSLQHSVDWNRTIIASSWNGFVGADADGRVVEWNASAERIFGWPRAQALGRSLTELLVPHAYRARHEAGMRRCIETGDGPVLNRRIELPALTASGRQIMVEMTISFYEWKGKRCFGAFMNDISEQIRTRQQLEEKQELLDAVLDSIDVGVVTCDAVGNLSLFNRAARTIVGRELKTIVPAEWSAYYAMYHVDGRTPLAMDEVPLVRALKGETIRDEAMVIAQDGSAVHTLLVSGRPLRGASGRPLGAVVAMKDITEANASRAQLEINERRLRAITENLPALIGKVNAAGRFVFLNGHALNVHRRTADELLGQDMACAYRPEDYATLSPYIGLAMSGQRVFFEYMSRSSGQELHYQCCLVPQHTSGGEPDGFYAMAFDITERKMSELRLAESEERLRTITDNLPVLIAHLDSERRYVFANAVHQSWLGKPAGQIIGKTMEEAFGADYLAPQAAALEQAWRGHASQCEHEIVRKKHTRIAHTTFLPQLRDGLVVGVYVLTTDATASRMHERSLHALAHTDTLTGLPNRRHFENALKGAQRAGRAGRGSALLYLDVDHFKQINDRYGHAVGDAVLVEFARRLSVAVRSSDLVSRLAGDEFTVLLHDVAGEADVELVARKILAAMRAPFELEAVVLQVGTSIGAALADQPDPVPARLLDAADRALYAAKEAGRNTFAMLRLGRSQALGLALAHD